MKKDLTVILPTLNEKENIAELIREIKKKVNPYQIIVVDDNSFDGTDIAVRQNYENDDGVVLMVNYERKGLTKSIQTGIESAKTKIVAWMDADFSHKPDFLNLMYKKMKDYDVVIGSWLIAGGKDKRQAKSERLRSRIINTVCRILFGPEITAYTSGFTMIRRKIFENYTLQGDYGEYFIHYCYFLIKNKFRIKEVPITIVSRVQGISKTSPDYFVLFKRGVKYLVMIGKLIVLDLYKKV